MEGVSTFTYNGELHKIICLTMNFIHSESTLFGFAIALDFYVIHMTFLRIIRFSLDYLLKMN